MVCFAFSKPSCVSPERGFPAWPCAQNTSGPFRRFYHGCGHSQALPPPPAIVINFRRNPNSYRELSGSATSAAPTSAVPGDFLLDAKGVEQREWYSKKASCRCSRDRDGELAHYAPSSPVLNMTTPVKGSFHPLDVLSMTSRS